MHSFQQSMERSYHTINSMSQTVLLDLEQKTTDLRLAERARTWFPRAKAAEQLTKDMNNYIEGLISLQNSHSLGDQRTVLQNKLQVYADSILALDPGIYTVFRSAFADSVKADRFKPSLSEMLRSMYHATEPEKAPILVQLKLSVAERGYAIISYCNEMSLPGCVLRFDTYTALIGQNSQAILPGEELEIFAGMGAFSKQAGLKISVNGRRVTVNDEGMMRYSFKPAGKPGTYQLPVVLDFVDQDGKQRSIEKTVTYLLLEAKP